MAKPATFDGYSDQYTVECELSTALRRCSARRWRAGTAQ